MRNLILFFVFLTSMGISSFTRAQSTAVKIKDLVIYEDPEYYSTFPSVIKKPDGEIMVAFRRAPNRFVFQEHKNNHVDPNSYLMMVRSRDNGLSWSKEPELIYAHPYGGSQDPCLYQLKDGTIWCTSYGWALLRPEGLANLKQPAFVVDGNSVFLGGYNLRSTDGGATWQGPYYPPSVPQEMKYTALGELLPAYNRGSMYEGKNGRLYWVVAGSDDPDNIRKTANFLLTSDDKGLTWDYHSVVATDDKVAFNETSIYETPKGDLVAFLRTAGYDGYGCITRSTDGGKTFQPWKSMGFKGHPFQATRLPDDRVLLVYGYRHQPYGIRAKILNPECTNYETAEEIIIRADGGSTDIGYPWATVLDDNKVLVTYYYNLKNGNRYIAGSILELQ